MKGFAALFSQLDQTTRTTVKLEAMVDYFRQADPRDAAWAAYFLCGRRPKRAITTKLLRAWAMELAEISEWLFEDCYDAVGDLGETIALLLPEPRESTLPGLADLVETQLLPLQDMNDAERKQVVLSAWNVATTTERLIVNKLITGGFRVGVSQLLVVRALAEVSGQPATTIAHRLMGQWSPTPEFYRSLIADEGGQAHLSRPYPFFLAHALEKEPELQGDANQWQAEWKWDGIRAQLIRRQGTTFVWSRGEELVSDRYPELLSLGKLIPDGVALDGELLPWGGDRPLPFAELQKRIGRKSLSKKLLADVPVVFMAYDLLEHGGEDCRSWPLSKRRAALEDLVGEVGDPRLKLSPVIEFTSWEDMAKIRTQSRQRGVEGMMLKRKESPYRVGRVRGDWWKWKIEPLTMDAVLTAAQRGHGKRASLYTDYTFSVWDAGHLVTVAKAYSGLTDAEIRDVDAFVRANILEKFGPVRTVRPQLVFELGFEGIQASLRHKSGVAVRFPRILRMRSDKKIEEADSLDNLRRLLEKKEPQ
jgi:DNA ligase-1